jgi:hypothetical protein
MEHFLQRARLIQKTDESAKKMKESGLKWVVLRLLLGITEPVRPVEKARIAGFTDPQIQ